MGKDSRHDGGNQERRLDPDRVGKSVVAKSKDNRDAAALCVGGIGVGKSADAKSKDNRDYFRRMLERQDAALKDHVRILKNGSMRRAGAKRSYAVHGAGRCG